LRRTRSFAAAIVLLAGTIFALAFIFVPKPTVNFESSTTKPSKKLIEYGWDVPSPAFLPANIRAMEQRPFDGIVVKLSVGPYIFTRAPIAESKFAQDREDLKATSFNRFTDNFLIVWASSEHGWNFLSDYDWAAAEQNVRNFARTAAAAGFKGILFDTETYGQNTWAYNTAIYPNTTYEQLQGVVRKRGARFMSLMQSELPSVRVLFTWFLGQIRDEFDATGGNTVNGNTPLLGAFVEGMFSTVAGDVQLIDGNETSYNYTDAASFDQSRIRLFDNINRVAADHREAARAHVQIGQAIYTDQLLNLVNSPRFSSFYIGKQQDRLLLLEHNVYHALRTTDEYVWFYSEKVEWWKKPNIPDGLEDAIRRAQALLTSGRAPAYDMHFVDSANKALGQAVHVSGQIVTKDGASVPRVVVGSGFYNLSGVESACYTDPNNYFDCILPNGWSGTLTPALKGYRFEPPALNIQNLIQGSRINFTAIPIVP
jgi:hypothetical protein